MGGRCVFVGDELSAAGYRLAGAECWTPAPDELLSLVRRLRAEDALGLLLITAEYAARLPRTELADALAAQRPPMLVIRDIRGRMPPRDATGSIRRQLGLAE
jgi:vacuolar-type H+-ATPase subunit F/Vma7